MLVLSVGCPLLTRQACLLLAAVVVVVAVIVVDVVAGCG